MILTNLKNQEIMLRIAGRNPTSTISRICEFSYFFLDILLFIYSKCKGMRKEDYSHNAPTCQHN
jgi:hypothetical protein